MLKVTLFGNPSAVEQNVRMLLAKEIVKADVDVQIISNQDAQSFIDNGIEILPTLILGDSRVSFNESDGIPGFVDRSIQLILNHQRIGKLRKIIVPTDFSEASVHAFRFAIELAQKTNGLIRLVHVYFPVTTSIDGLVYVDPEIENVLRKKLLDFKTSMETTYQNISGPVPMVEDLFLVGQASKEIEKLVEEGKGDIVVMGSMGDKDVFKNLLGSVSVSVARNADCPVFVIPPDVAYRPFRRILIASDDDVLDPGVITAVQFFVGNQDCELDVIHLNDASTTFVEDGIEIMEEDEKVGQRKVVLYREDLIGGLHDYAEKEDIDLIVMERKDRTIWQRMFHKSSTREMTIKTHFPLLILHEDDVTPFKKSSKLKA